MKKNNRGFLAKIGSVTMATGIGVGVLLSSALPANAADNEEFKATVDRTVGNSVENTANHLLTAFDEGKIPEGTSVEQLKEIAPDAFKVDAGVQMGIVFVPEYPSYFSLCSWTEDGAITQDKAAAFKSATGTFSPMPIDCSNNDGAVNPVVLDVEQVGTVAAKRPEGLDFPTIAAAEQAVPEAGQPTPEAAPAPVQQKPSEPLDTKPLIIGGSIIAGIAVLIGLGFMTYFLTGKVRNNTQQNSMNAKQWIELVERCDDIIKKWSSYELDPTKILDFPLLSDMREELTRQFHSALRRAKHLRPENVNKVKSLPALSSPFAKAVDELEAAFAAAEIEAKRVRWSRFSKDERKRLEMAKKLLDIAMNEGASESERQSAYKRMQKELEGLIVVPDATILALTEKINLQLTDGSEVPA
ncbi:MAG: hypothetical protein H9W81_12325 [Enterococcus sp.]|nr:hypothetical protein [Enterococcus sp.]